jgi:outer membrane protein assembly factor BamB
VLAASSWWLTSHEYLGRKTVLTEQRRFRLGLPLHDPRGIAYAQGKVYVACYGERSPTGDTGPGEVIEQDLGTGGTRRLRPRQAGREVAWSHPGDLKLGRDGLLYVLNNGPGDQALLVLKDGTEVVRRVALPTTSTGAKGLELGPEGTVLVTDMPGGRIVAYRVDDDGHVRESRTVAGGLMNPSAIALDQGGRIYLAQTYEWVQQLASDGTPLARLARCQARSFAVSPSESGWIEAGCDDSVFSIDVRDSSTQMARVAPGGRPILARIGGMTYGPDGTLYVLQGDTLVSYRVRH